ncbi:hypothetical protein TNCV_3307821 [Trichonephila clavipes]|nr:hypothetical protein TNCV_3307821 [Trichonephila clavipes]
MATPDSSFNPTPLGHKDNLGDCIGISNRLRTLKKSFGGAITRGSKYIGGRNAFHCVVPKSQPKAFRLCYGFDTQTMKTRHGGGKTAGSCYQSIRTSTFALCGGTTSADYV